MSKFRTPYAYGKRPDGYRCDTASHTQQHFADETDINKLIDIAMKTKSVDALLSMQTKSARYGDVSNLSDYQRSLDIVFDVEDRFMSLPATLRRHFNDDPAEYIDFISNPDNHAKGVELGIFEKTEDASSLALDVASVEQPEGASKESSKAADDVRNSSS